MEQLDAQKLADTYRYQSADPISVTNSCSLKTIIFLVHGTLFSIVIAHIKRFVLQVSRFLSTAVLVQ